MKIREVIYIAIISALSVITIISYQDAQRSQEILNEEMLFIKQRRDQQFSIQEQQQNEYEKVLEVSKIQQKEYGDLLKKYKIEMEEFENEKKKQKKEWKKS
jgi:type II secretory pathway pseudopilin PulG